MKSCSFFYSTHTINFESLCDAFHARTSTKTNGGSNRPSQHDSETFNLLLLLLPLISWLQLWFHRIHNMWHLNSAIMFNESINRVHTVTYSYLL